MQYSIVQHSDPKGLNKLINKAIAQGWEPQGGVSVSSERTSTFSRYSVYCQAMVLHSDKETAIEDSGGDKAKEPGFITKATGTILVVAIIAAIVKYVF